MKKDILNTKIELVVQTAECCAAGMCNVGW